jgi:hypothetical protein
VISRGTGVTEQKPSKSIIPIIGKGKRLLEKVTGVQCIHFRFRSQMENQRIDYFRFNPDTANDNIGLADYKMLDTLERHILCVRRSERKFHNDYSYLCAGPTNLGHQKRIPRTKHKLPNPEMKYTNQEVCPLWAIRHKQHNGTTNPSKAREWPEKGQLVKLR